MFAHLMAHGPGAGPSHHEPRDSELHTGTLKGPESQKANAMQVGTATTLSEEGSAAGRQGRSSRAVS